jgi:hypothetical protein
MERAARIDAAVGQAARMRSAAPLEALRRRAARAAHQGLRFRTAAGACWRRRLCAAVTPRADRVAMS